MHRALAGIACLVVSLVCVRSAGAQPQVVFQEDFENGLGAWTMESWPLSSQPAWHISEDGDCGVSVTRMAALGENCGYGKATFSEDGLESQVFTVPDTEYLFVVFDAIWDMDPPGPTGGVAETNLGVGLWNQVKWGHLLDHHFWQGDAGNLQTVTVPFWLDKSWPGDPCTLRFSVVTDTVGNTGSGLHIDNVRIVTNAGSDLGLSDPHGPAPGSLNFAGPMLPGTENVLTAYALPPRSPALLVVGQSLAPAMASGVLVNPAPLLVLPLITPQAQMPGGKTELFWTFDGSVLPPGTDLFLQVLTFAAGAWSASNTVHVAGP